MDEAALIAACQAGDPDAWQALHRRYQPRIWGFFRKRLERSADIADCCQETWLVVARKLGETYTGGLFWAWLATVAHRVHLNHLRIERKHRRCVYDPEAAHEVADASAAAADTAIRRAMVASLLPRIRQPRDREIVYMRCWLDMTWDAIGAHYGVTRAAMIARYEQVISDLREYLGVVLLPEPAWVRPPSPSIEVQHEATQRWLAGEYNFVELAALYGFSVSTMQRAVRRWKDTLTPDRPPADEDHRGRWRKSS